MTAFPKPRIVVSKCLGFDPCRYDGEVVENNFVAELEPHVNFVCVCPEVEIGLGTPRAPVRLVSASGDAFKLIQPSSGFDVSERMTGFSAGFLDSVGELDGFLLKNRSPSCGIADVKFYAGPEKGPAIGRTAGIFGAAVLERFPDLAVEDEGRLMNLAIREHFLTRIFAFARFRALEQSGSLGAMVRFHATHKLLLMSYSQLHLRELGRIVANAKKQKLPILLRLYKNVFHDAFRRIPRRTSPINVLMHAAGYFKTQLNSREKTHFLTILNSYRGKKLPVSAPIAVLRSWISRFETSYLLDQTFFQPFPDPLITLQDSARQ